MNQMNFFITYLWKDPMFFLAAIIIVVFSVCAHEFMHAWIALLQGDGTAAERGHLTMSPLKQMGPWSLFMLAFIGIAWGQVPVDPSRMRHRYSHALSHSPDCDQPAARRRLFSALLPRVPQ